MAKEFKITADISISIGSAGPSVPTYNTIYDSHTVENNNAAWLTNDINRLSAQQFTPDFTGNIGAITLKQWRTAAGRTGNSRISIMADNAGDPSGTRLAEFTFDVTTLPTTSGAATDVKYNFDAPLAVTSGTTYWFHAECLTIGGSGSINVFYDGPTGGLSPETFSLSTNGGTSWSTNALDVKFTIWGE